MTISILLLIASSVFRSISKEGKNKTIVKEKYSNFVFNLFTYPIRDTKSILIIAGSLCLGLSFSTYERIYSTFIDALFYYLAWSLSNNILKSVVKNINK